MALQDLATKKIRELIEISTLGGYIPLDSAAFGTKKFDASKLALASSVQAAINTVDRKASQNATNIQALNSRITAVENKVEGVLSYIGDASISEIEDMNTASIPNGNMYSLTEDGTIHYVFDGAQKSLEVEQFDEIAWSKTKGWNIIGKDRRTDLSDYSKTSEFKIEAGSEADRKKITLGRDGAEQEFLVEHQSLESVVAKSEVSVSAVSGDDTKKKIQLKNGLSQDVVVEHQDISGKADKSELKEVAFSGSYTDLTGTPQMAITPGTGANADKTNIQLQEGMSATVLVEHQDISGKTDSSQLKIENGSTADKKKVVLGPDKEQEFLISHQDITGKANKDEMQVTPGTGANADKTTIQLKNDLSATVLTAHQDVTGKAEKSEMTIEPVSGDETKKTIQLKSGLSQDVVTAHQDVSGKANKSEMAITDNGNGSANVQLKEGLSATVLTEHQDISGKADKNDLAEVAFTGSFSDLTPGVGKPHFLKAVSDSTVDDKAPYGYWIVDLEKPNEEADFGYDYAMVEDIIEGLEAGEFYVLSTYGTAPSTEEDFFIMTRAQDQTTHDVPPVPGVRIWFASMFHANNPATMRYTTIYNPSIYNSDPSADTYPEGRMAILNVKNEQNCLSSITFTASTPVDYGDTELDVHDLYTKLEAGEGVTAKRTTDGADAVAVKHSHVTRTVNNEEVDVYTIWFSTNYILPVSTSADSFKEVSFEIFQLEKVGDNTPTWSTITMGTNRFNGEYLADGIYDPTVSYNKGVFIYYPKTGLLYTPTRDGISGIAPDTPPVPPNPPAWGKVALSRILQNIQTEVTEDISHAVETIGSRILFVMDPSAVSESKEIDFSGSLPQNPGEGNVVGTFFTPTMNFDLSDDDSNGTNVLYICTQTGQVDNGLTPFAYFAIFRYDAPTVESPTATNTWIATSEDISDDLLHNTGMHSARIKFIADGETELRSDKLYYLVLVSNFKHFYLMGNSVGNYNVLSTAGFTFAFKSTGLTGIEDPEDFGEEYPTLSIGGEYTVRFFGVITNLGFKENWNVIMRTLDGNLGIDVNWLMAMIDQGSLYQKITIGSTAISMASFEIIDNQENVPGQGSTNNCLANLLKWDGNGYSNNDTSLGSITITTTAISNNRYKHLVTLATPLTLAANTDYLFPAASSLPNPTVGTAVQVAEYSGSGIPTRTVYAVKNKYYVSPSDSNNVYSCGNRTGFYLKINGTYV